MKEIDVGLDIGSTTTKVLVREPNTGEVLYWRYKRHGARQAASAAEALEEVRDRFGDATVRVAVTGSGARDIATALGAVYIQEVVANSLAIQELYPRTRCAIELGGQDAKMIFFHEGADGRASVSDMRMNGSCAGGTGAFIDEMAKLLGVDTESGAFEELAAQGTTVYDVSGRCGVYAKTDIQPLLNQGVSTADLALSALHAVARQTIGGLAQGIDIEAPVIFEGGTLAYNPTLVRVFTEQLNLALEDVLVPDEPQVMVARGAALALSGALADQARPVDLARGTAALRELADHPHQDEDERLTQPFFANDAERADFANRHKPEQPTPGPGAYARGACVRASLGIDSGSTTTKFAVVDDAGELIDSFYANNEGSPLDTAKRGLMELKERWEQAGVALAIDAVGTTGYGEELFARAFHADYHTVETVAHARAATACEPDATFVLDIGGQDMKAIWLDGGVLTDIVVNEACSAGCGSFLEGFAKNLGIEVEDIASSAFASAEPACLGSRCTVFMNSSVVSEQRRGKGPGDIMAGLCRSIIENVFTKVIRVSNLDKLGERIVVQGGTFRNDAVLRAFEQFVGRPVTRAPHPGLMGAIGVAMLAAEHMRSQADEGGAVPASSFVGLEAAASFTHEQYAGVTCNRCGNHCQRSVVAFGDGSLYVTGNRCPRGLAIDWDELVCEVPEAAELRPAVEEDAAENAAGADSAASEGLIVDGTCPDPAAPRNSTSEATCTEAASDALAHASVSAARTDEASPHASASMAGKTSPRAAVADAEAARTPLEPAPNLFVDREKLLFQTWPYTPLCDDRNITIGIPRVLEFWDVMPFWSTLFRSLGFNVQLSRPSTRKMFEEGLPHVTSDTVCFPAKLVHGHVRDLVRKDPDRIFMPIITTVPTENTAKTSEWMCAVVKGYPYVMKNSDNPEKRFGIPFDTPLFHWYDTEDRDRQLERYLNDVFGIEPALTDRAIEQAETAQTAFANQMELRGEQVLERVRAEGGYAVVLASRPYHNDELVNHGLPKMLAQMGIPVLTPDAVPGVRNVDLSNSRLDIVNNYHARMLSASVIAASSPELELVQLVSFGCGHDAYLSDEMVRMMREISGKTPLVLKVDESDATGPLSIRLRSFIETVERRRAEEAAEDAPVREVRELSDPYRVKYTKRDRKEKIALIPNTSHAFCRLMTAAVRNQGVRAEALDIGREEAIRLGKRYVHNDICFPAQIVIGECLEALESGKYDPHDVAVVTGKYVGDCRLTHYMPLLRQALDDAGYDYVPIVTNDDVDAHNAHPGFKLSLASSIQIAFGLPRIDALEAILRRIRPYELERGAADAAFERAMDELIGGLEQSGLRGLDRGFKRALKIMDEVPHDRSDPRPTVLIVGEYLLNFHPGANHEIERYLEDNGLEVIEAKMTDVIRKTYFYKHAQSREYHVDLPLQEKIWYATADKLFDIAHDRCDKLGAASALYEPPARMDELVQASDPVLHHTFDAGEGVLIPAEILEHASRGCRSFVILQPFGCLPNHVVGRGLVRALKERYPDANILPLDYDPDVSFANIENRLQMLIMSARARGGASDSTA